MSEKKSNCAEDLYISHKFPPMNDVAGIVLAKRAITDGKAIDVVHDCISEPLDNDFNEIIEELIDNRIILKNFELSDGKKEFREDFSRYITVGLEKIEKTGKDYKSITTCSWGLPPVFLALEYKLKHPQTKWTAEFSDPILYNLDNTRRGGGFTLDNEEYIKRINAEIDKLNEKLSKEGKDIQISLINESDEIYFLCEYLAYVFADTVRFTNENQREIMLSQFPYDIKDYVMEKSEIKPYPTLDKKYYHIKEVDYEIDDDCINIAYFGTYFGQRNFETIFYAIESLDEKIQNKIKFHLFTEHGENLKRLTSNLKMSKNIIVSDKVSLLEFLNLSTKLDVLLVNDTETKGKFKINPYRPSKISDYIGSGRDIWGICEKNSAMDSLEEITYKSYINDFYSTKLAIQEIVANYSNKINLKASFKHDETKDKEKLNEFSLNNFNKSFDDLEEEEILEIFYEKEFLTNRLNHINDLINKSYGRALFADEALKITKKTKKLSNKNKKLSKKNKKLTQDNERLKSENEKLKKELNNSESKKDSMKSSMKHRIKKIIK